MSASMTFDLERARRTTPARLGVGRAGSRPPTNAWLRFQADHAAARDAVWSEWSPAFRTRLERLGFLLVSSAAPDRLAYLREPPLGRRLAAGERERIVARRPADVAIQIVLSDGLSAQAAERHFERVHPALRDHLARLGSLGTPVAVRNGRVAIADEIGGAVGARLVVHLIGERPGLGTADSLGCYLTFAPGPSVTDADRKCVSNIRDAGLVPDEAGATIAGVCRRILEVGTSGTGLVL
jgi:ethanolamine ammonia-lyase small subunit